MTLPRTLVLLASTLAALFDFTQTASTNQPAAPPEIAMEWLISP